MTYHTIHHDIQVFPALIAEHMMLAIVQGRQIDAIDPQRHVIFAPRDVGVFSFTLL